MKLEEILKSLEKGECKKCYTTDECHHLIEVWYDADGYRVALGGDASFYTDPYKTVEELLETVGARYMVKWTEFDYEEYSEPWELKKENARLKKALELACKHLTKHCDSLCPLYDLKNAPCNEKNEVIPVVGEEVTFADVFEYVLQKDVDALPLCINDTTEYFLKKAEEELGNES